MKEINVLVKKEMKVTWLKEMVRGMKEMVVRGMMMSEFNNLKKVWDKYQAAVEQAKKDGVQAPPHQQTPKQAL